MIFISLFDLWNKKHERGQPHRDHRAHEKPERFLSRCFEGQQKNFHAEKSPAYRGNYLDRNSLAACRLPLAAK
jgi:hypothetical protein